MSSDYSFTLIQDIQNYCLYVSVSVSEGFWRSSDFQESQGSHSDSHQCDDRWHKFELDMNWAHSPGDPDSQGFHQFIKFELEMNWAHSPGDRDS